MVRTVQWNGPGNGDDYSQSIALDRLGNVFVTGYSTGLTSGYDFATLRYDSSGVQQWVQRYTTAGNNFDMALSVAVDTSGGVYVAGVGYDAVEYNNYLTVKYQDAALPVELTSFSATVNGGDVKLEWNTATEVNNYGFEIERSEKIKVKNEKWERIGFVEGSGTTNAPIEYSYNDKNLSAGRYQYRLKQIDRDGAFKYSQSAETEVGVAPKAFGLSQNYPNPFNPSTTIEYSLVASGLVSVRVYDVLGREVASLVNERQEAGTYAVRLDASRFSSGFYYYTLSAGASVSTRKMLLLK